MDRGRAIGINTMERAVTWSTRVMTEFRAMRQRFSRLLLVHPHRPRMPMFIDRDHDKFSRGHTHPLALTLP